MGLFGGGNSSSSSNVSNKTINKNVGLSDVSDAYLLNEASNVNITDSGIATEAIGGVVNVANQSIERFAKTTSDGFDYGESIFDRASTSGENYFNNALDFAAFATDETLNAARENSENATAIVQQANKLISENATSEGTRTANKTLYLVFGLAALGTIILVTRSK